MRGAMTYTELLIRICGGIVVGILYRSFIVLNWDLTLAGATRIIVVHCIGDRAILGEVVLLLVLIIGGHFVL